jgi:bifunctional ADP-heptose synthase (sugar kinase/adenylyltransferase)
MLTTQAIEQIIAAIPRLSVAVLGDLFLDRYLDIDGTLTEPSVETGLDAYQVVQVRSYPGAAGTVINNLAALGVGVIPVIAVIGDDGEGYELRQALARMPAVQTAGVFADPGRRTPTYTKPMLAQRGLPPCELNRIDTKNRRPLPADAHRHVLQALDVFWPKVDALIVLDQVSEDNCGVVTSTVRDCLGRRGEAEPAKIVLADSRERIGLFRNMRAKPNEAECVRAVPGAEDSTAAAQMLACRTGRTVFCTGGNRGMIVAEPESEKVATVAAYPVTGPIDPVGAGDSANAALACALACGRTAVEAAAFANLVASITVQQIGVTGTATPEQIRKRWKEV